VQAFRDAVALAPDRAQIWYFLGDEYFHYRQGLDEDHSETSEAYFQRALRLDPRHGAAATHLGQVYLQRGDLEALDRTNSLLASLDTSALAQTQMRLSGALTAADTAGYGAALADVLASEDLWTLGGAMYAPHEVSMARDTVLVSAAVLAAERILTLPLRASKTGTATSGSTVCTNSSAARREPAKYWIGWRPRSLTTSISRACVCSTARTGSCRQASVQKAPPKSLVGSRHSRPTSTTLARWRISSVFSSIASSRAT
jgi:hypothetical protein